MAIDFPASPTLNDVFTVGNVNYVWDGTKWTASVTGGISLDKIEEGNTSAEVVDTGSDGRFVVTTDGSEALRVDASGFTSLGGDVDTGFSNPSANNLAISTGGTERARIDSSGRLLVGTSSSRQVGDRTHLIQIEGNSSGDGGVSMVRNFNDDNATSFTLAKTRGTSVGATTIVQNGDKIGEFAFAAADGSDVITRAASIRADVDGTPGPNDMPGRLVFSVTRDGEASPTGRAQILNGGRLLAFCSAGADGHTFMTAEGAGTTYDVIACYRSTTSVSGASAVNVFRVFSNGNVANTNNSYTGLSDIKLKENIVDANSQWDDLKALRVRNYNLKEGQTHTQIGLIAQEVELVSPGLVSESPDRDVEGNDLGTVTKSVNYSVLYMKAVKALQEAMERIETLEAKVAALEAQ